MWKGEIMKHATIMLIAFMLLFFVGSMPRAFDAAGNNSQTMKTSISEKMIPSYESHDIIKIFNDTDFMWQAGNETWPGDGSEEFPYIITGYNITNDVTVSIEIRDVTAYFEIRDCYIRGTNPNVGGIVLYNITHGHVGECIIVNKNTGLNVDYCDNLTVVNCTMEKNADGMTLGYCNYTTITSCYFINTTTGSGWLQDQSHWTIITDSYFIDNGDYGLETYYSDYFTVSNCGFSGNDYSGLIIDTSHHGLYQGNSVFDNGDDGISMYSSNYVTFIENEIHENHADGFYISGNDFVYLRDNIVHNNRIDGINFDVSDDSIIEENQVFDNGWTSFELGAVGNGIIVEVAENISLLGNTVYNNSAHGIQLGMCTKMVVHENIIYGNFGFEGECGIYVVGVNHCDFTNNIVYNNTENGIFMMDSVDCVVSHNVVYENTINGIYLLTCNRTSLLYNDFGWNPTNALDESGTNRKNYWNNSMVGNWYSDYNGTGPYNITNTLDYFPSMSLFAGSLEDLEYELGSTGNEVIMAASALNPWYYEFYINGELVDSFNWFGGNIHANVDGLDVGVHNISIVVYHVSGHSLFGEAQVTVEDTTPPEWVTDPENQMVYYGNALIYQLSVIDFSEIAEWSVNDTRFIITDGLLTGSSLLPIGTYALHITVSDIYDNEQSADILIQVIEEPTTSTTSTTTTTTSAITDTTAPTSGGADLLTIGILVAAGGIVLVIVLVFVMKRKGT
jgi:parallel beta-helix repeat protein